MGITSAASSTQTSHRRGHACLWLGLVLLLACFAARGDDQAYFFSRINGQTAGLAQNSVHVLFQDQQGYVWIGTEGGLNRFDGYSLERHTHDPTRHDSLPAGVVTAITDAGHGNLWIGMLDGTLLRYDPTNQRTLETLAKHAGRRVSALFRGADGRIWVGSDVGIWRLAADSHKLERIYQMQRPRVDARDTPVASFAQCPDGSLYAATHDGLLAIRAGQAQRLGQPQHISAVACGRHNQLFIATRQRIARIDRDSGAAKTLWQVPATGRAAISGLAVDPVVGNLWATVRHLGLLKLRPDDEHSLLLAPDSAQRHGLPGTLFTSLLMDRSGLVWVGTAAEGVAHAPSSGSAIHLITNRATDVDTEAANNVRAIFEGRRGRYWVGTRGAGLQLLLPDKGRFIERNRALRQALGRPADAPISVQAIAGGTPGTLWLATNHGVLQFDADHNSARRLDLGKPATALDRYRDIQVDSDGGLWLAGVDSGLIHYRPGTGVIARYTPADGLPDQRVLSVARDAKGRLWAGTLQGLALFDAGSKRFRSFTAQPRRDDSLVGSRVTAFRVDAAGAFWIATNAGLNKLLGIDAAGLHVQRITRRDGLPDNMAYCVLDDHRGHLWVSSNLGIAGIDSDTGTVRRLTLADGLQGLEFNARACLRDSHGNLWFGGVHGLNKVMPRWMLASRFDPPTVITAVRLGQQTTHVDPERRLRVPPEVQVVRFRFASLDYKQPAANRFRYRMLGVGKQWLDNGTSHEVSYSNLEPGHYRFEVRGSNHDGVFSTHAASVTLLVVPPWWATTAARVAAVVLLALLLALAAFALYRHRATLVRHRRELIDYDQRLRLALWGSGDRFWDYDVVQGRLSRIVAAHPNQREPDENLDFNDWSATAIHPDDLGRLRRRAQAHLHGDADRFESEHRVRSESGEWHWVRSRGQVVERDAGGQPVRMAGTTHDLAKERADLQQRRIAAWVIRSMAEAVVVTDLEFRFVTVNPAFTRMFGYSHAETRGRDAHLLDGDHHSASVYDDIRALAREHGTWRGELWQRRKDGEDFLCWLEINAVKDADNNLSHYVGVLSDITERKRAEQELRYLASYDPLSGLPNRTSMQQHLSAAIREAAVANLKVAVLFIDMDRFKQVNDAMGHSIGDRMLGAAGARLRGQLRASDMVARLGGDEFGVVLDNIGDAEAATKAARMLVHAFHRPLVLDSGQELLTSPSIGIALYPDHGKSAAELLKFADTAMYQAKSGGRNTWMLYTSAMEARARKQASLVTELRQALGNGELSVLYQPQLDIDDWRITGAEALLRWHSPLLGEVPPSTFIPLAEDAGLIADIGEFVISSACATLADWRQAGLGDLAMAVNISSAQLLSTRLYKHLTETLEQHRIPARRLVLELTEGLVMSRAEISLHNLGELKALGIALAVDDFGTGYSSLAYLKTLPVDTLKIDKSFVSDITHDPSDEVITRTIINIGHALGLRVVAEGVETVEQLAYLAEQDCDAIQGHWLSRAVSARNCLALMQRHDPEAKPDLTVP